jgi:hypothetical protein
MFANYFAKEGETLANRPLEEGVKKDFRKWEEQADYLKFLDGALKNGSTRL